MVFADKEPLKAMSKPWVELAHQFSFAVNFNKTGVPAVIPPHLHVTEYPDFMEKPDKPTYQSHNVIGKLFSRSERHCPAHQLCQVLYKWHASFMTLIWKWTGMKLTCPTPSTLSAITTSWETR
ncbi:unnamed protein product [Linum tenue]|uniref:RNA-dependent RNA polymerase n=1 Tax=Linum tenue TaxID=586396 RepID=A0AAV0NK06_9ROSI|nr:unnamed protein product [Linum tenue]